MPDIHRIAILTDSTSDISTDLARELGITIVPFAMRFDHGSFHDGEHVSTVELVERMEHSTTIPSVSSPSPRAFEEAFLDLAENHDSVVAILISSRLSSAVKSATIAGRAVKNHVAVTVVDSLNTSFGLGLQVLRAVDLLHQGASTDRLVGQLQSEITLNHVVFFVETLEHLRRSGRVGKASEMLGSFLQLKPVLRIDEGQVIPFERARTRARALETLVEFAQSIPAIDEIAVICTTPAEDVEMMIPHLELLVDASHIHRVQFGTALTTQIGPGSVGIAIREKPVA